MTSPSTSQPSRSSLPSGRGASLTSVAYDSGGAWRPRPRPAGRDAAALRQPPRRLGTFAPESRERDDLVVDLRDHLVDTRAAPSRARAGGAADADARSATATKNLRERKISTSRCCHSSSGRRLRGRRAAARPRLKFWGRLFPTRFKVAGSGFTVRERTLTSNPQRLKPILIRRPTRSNRPWTVR